MFRIKKLDIFIVKQFGLLFVGTFFICQFVLMMQFLWRYVDELIGKGLSMEVLAQFFWYMGLMLIPQALPLAILLSSLISFGNLGESSELTAIKAAGISLIQTCRSLIVSVVLIACCSYFFQDVIGPEANKSFRQLLLSMKQKSPELEIPEGIFYDGIPGSNIYVQKKDLKTGMLYGVMIYRMNGGYEDAAIILADSGMMQSTEEKKHLLLTLHSGEWFENMRSQDMAGSASVPYRRETFATKRIVLDFDGGFNMADAAGISSSAQAKSMKRILHDLDSIRIYNDSVGHAFYNDAKNTTFFIPQPHTAEDSVKLAKAIADDKTELDSIFQKMSIDDKQAVVKEAMNTVRMKTSEMEMKGDYSFDLNKNVRTHQIEAINKITLSLSCIIFFFIGAPLGAIIKKGGIGTPLIISVLLFIVYFIIDNAGYKAARDGKLEVWQGIWLSTAVLLPLGVFFTYKAVGDSAVFNVDAYRNFFRRLRGKGLERSLTLKEVRMAEVERDRALEMLADFLGMVREAKARTAKAPLYLKLYRRLSGSGVSELRQPLGQLVDYLSNSPDIYVINYLNQYPFNPATRNLDAMVATTEALIKRIE